MTSNRRACVNHPDNFCYICGQYTPKEQCRNITKSIQLAYNYYFDCKLGDQDKEWATHVCCAPWNSMLSAWMNGKRKAISFLVPIVWHEHKNHFNDCYFCMTNIIGFTKKNKSMITYPNWESARKLVPHDETDMTNTSSYEESSSDTDSGEGDMYFLDTGNSPHLLGQAELNDLVRDLELTKEKAELLGSRLQERNLLKPATKISHFRSHNMKFSSFYAQEENVCFCNDISGLMQEIGCCYDPSEWRLFIDSSKASLIAVLLHNGNENTSSTCNRP